MSMHTGFKLLLCCGYRDVLKNAITLFAERSIGKGRNETVIADAPAWIGHCSYM
jgi:hypothetical protein